MGYLQRTEATSEMNESRIEVHIKTNEYAIGLPGKHRLYTQFVNTCTAFMGIEPETGVTFLCHLNSPASVSSLPTLVEELLTHVEDVSRFRLYTLGGISPRWFWALSPLLALLGWSIGHKFAPLWGVIGAIACTASLPGFFGLTQWALRRKLKESNVFAAAPISLGFSSVAWGFGRTDITIDECSREHGPWKRSYFRDPMDERFEAMPPRKFSCAWWRCNWVPMTRAQGSALPRERGSDTTAPNGNTTP